MGAKLKKLTEKLNGLKQKFGKKSQMIVVLILSLVMLIIFFNGLKKPSQNEAKTKQNSEAIETKEDYVRDLENRLENLLQSLNSVSSAEVFIMTETSTKVIYAVDEKRDESMALGDTKEVTSSSEIVFSKNGSSSTPIVSVEVYPEIVGVLIIADSTGDEKTRLMIINAVSVALNINNSKIEVLLANDA